MTKTLTLWGSWACAALAVLWSHDSADSSLQAHCASVPGQGASTPEHMQVCARGLNVFPAGLAKLERWVLYLCLASQSLDFMNSARDWRLLTSCIAMLLAFVLDRVQTAMAKCEIWHRSTSTVPWSAQIVLGSENTTAVST